MGFFDKVFKDDKSKSGSNASGLPNPFANLGGGRSTFHGHGQSLGGSKPGTVILISLADPGPLGVRIEKRPNSEGTAIVNEVVPGSQAEASGLKRGDILCFAGSQGQEEMMYDMFLELAKSNRRPIELEVRRIENKTAATNAKKVNKSADADHRRQAVIAAAEAREKAHRNRSKPVQRLTKTTQARLEQQQLSTPATSDTSQEPLSEASRQAAAAAKQGEAQLTSQLGYNPYETARATAGQGRTATNTAQHGSLSADHAGNHPGTVVPPREATTDTDITDLPLDFQEAWTTLCSSGETTSATILKKLILNATTKSEEKFRKVRLANDKIKTLVVDVPGALEILLAVGFLLNEQNGESVLIYPVDTPGPTWLPAALQCLEHV